MALVLIVPLAAIASAHEESNAPPEPALTGAGGDVLARVGATTITRRELEGQIEDQLVVLQRKQRDLLLKGLDQLVDQRLLELEAKSRGMSPEQLLQIEVDAKLAEPTEAEVDEYYAANATRLPSKAENPEQIKAYLKIERQREARRMLLRRLAERLGVTKMLKPFRSEIATHDAPARGPAGARVTIVEFSDFQCSFCQRVQPTLERIRESYGDRVRLVFRQFPLAGHAQARPAAEASLCAGEQGKFWEMHDAMFADQRRLQVEDLKSTASRLGLDAEAFSACFDSGRFAKQVEQDLAEGKRAGVTGTPALFVNGRLVSGAVAYEKIAAVIDEELRSQAVTDAGS